MLRQCSRLRSQTRFGLVKTRGFAVVNSRTRLARLRPLAIGATAVGGYAAYTFWKREEDEIELPAVPEPTPHFQHPYEMWPWYQKAWFAFKRSVSCPQKVASVLFFHNMNLPSIGGVAPQVFLAWVFAPFMCRVLGWQSWMTSHFEQNLLVTCFALSCKADVLESEFRLLQSFVCFFPFFLTLSLLARRIYFIDAFWKGE